MPYPLPAKVPYMDFVCRSCGKRFRHRKRPDREVKFCSPPCYFLSKKGKKAWNSGLTGLPPSWNKGIPMRESSKKLLSDAHKGKHFSPRTEFKKGMKPHKKNEGKQFLISSKGYIKINLPTHPRADLKGYVFEHILVAIACLERPLDDAEVIHHIDEVKTNNEPSNLYVFENNWEHLAFHARKKKYGTVLKSNLI